jgi:hypothetical protein
MITLLPTLCKRYSPDNPEACKKLPKQAGLYIICLNKDAVLPPLLTNVTFKKLNGLRILYVGISGRSIYKRHNRQHFHDKGVSTLRKSVGVLFRYLLIQRSTKTGWKKTRFSDKDEQLLSAWMKKNLTVYYHITPDYEKLERAIIDAFNPPVNVKGNKNAINLAFRTTLTALRKFK